MVVGNIERAPTEDERREYRGVGIKTPRELFLVKVAEIEAKFTKNHKPFDSPCAKLDYTDKIDDIEKESERVYGRVRPGDIEKVDLGDLEKYGDMSRFKLIREDEEIEMVNINGVKSSIKTGVSIKYVCERGHGFTVFVPMEVYEKEYMKKEVKEDKK